MTALAQALAGRMELHGARIAAQRLANEFGYKEDFRLAVFKMDLPEEGEEGHWQE